MYNHTRYIIVCKNERQAKLLFEDIVTYWNVHCRPHRGWRGKLNFNYKNKIIMDPLTTVRVVPERKLYEVTQGSIYLQCRLINGLHASSWLDEKRKERIEKEKQNDHIES